MVINFNLDDVFIFIKYIKWFGARIISQNVVIFCNIIGSRWEGEFKKLNMSLYPI